ncbi:DNAJ heat shock N-terminal domain-containing protein [Striga hermonthica]|uniref:DNAJ heat shock N-terminal domain-containing protein n=1 Tax=Striga hermonthica TaxID=68872 RepID=A0A9N7RCW9_STRHE|nr:DNAJ heat shock N-terminal domain-containing protein [Striga hermonthica]
MDCNKEEAARAKSISESKLEQRDFVGALKFAQKAQSLDPSLHGISQMLTTLDVLVSSERTINGEVDWYSILRVDPTADENDIKRQYKRLALVLHPDKNPSACAADAFKLVSEAKNLLLDAERRWAHDLITSRGPPNEPPPEPERNFGRPTSSETAAPPPPEEDVFWTFCHHCGLQFEYLKIFHCTMLVCVNCHGTFMSFEIQRSRSHTPRPWEGGGFPAACHTGVYSFAYAMYRRRGPLFGTNGN